MTTALLDLIQSPDFEAAVTRRAGEPTGPILANVASEVHLGLGLLSRPPVGPLQAGQRVLEVGAGTGVLASILKAQGLDVTAIEPLIAGFGVFGAIRDQLCEQVPADLAPLDTRTAAELDPARDGLFDVIFSINVLEHCKPLDETLLAMARVLAPGGRMIHTCPNYRVPYEPHYGIPLVPVVPSLTAKLRPKLATEPLWQSFNFITAGDVRRIARRAGLSVQFAPGVLAEVSKRLTTDDAFATRQGWAGRMIGVLHKTKVLRLVERIPATWMTPMVTVFEKPAR